MARALADGDPTQLRQLLPGLPADGKNNQPRSVLVLCANVEQAVNISQLLPDWPLLLGRDANLIGLPPLAGRHLLDGKLLPYWLGHGSVIATTPGLQRFPVHADAVVRADGGTGIPPGLEEFRVAHELFRRPRTPAVDRFRGPARQATAARGRPAATGLCPGQMVSLGPGAAHAIDPRAECPDGSRLIMSTELSNLIGYAPQTADGHYRNRQRRRCWNWPTWNVRRADTANRILNPDHLVEVFTWMRQHGGEAPGPDGVGYADLGRSEVRQVIRLLSREAEVNRYLPGPGHGCACRKQAAAPGNSHCATPSTGWSLGH